METPLDPAGLVTDLPRIFGKPVIFQQVKQLQRVGITDIVIAVDAIPGELPQFVEQLSQDGIRVRLMRPNIISCDNGFQSPFLLVSQDLWVDDALLREVVRWKAQSIGIVEEDPAHSLFERIDLNRRWSGLAVLQSDYLQYSKDMPDGWSFASFLLRHALQSGAGEVPIDRRLKAGGLLKRISNPADFENLFSSAMSNGQSTGILESLVSRISFQLVPPVARNSSLLVTFRWAPVLLSLVSVGLAFLEFSVPAAAMIVLTLSLEQFRNQLRAIEYHDKSSNYGSLFVHIIAVTTMLILLWRSGEFLLDAVFLTFAASGLLVMALLAPHRQAFRFMSPLAMAVLLCLGSILNSLALFTKIGILLMTALSLWAGWRSIRNDGQLNSN